MRPKNGEPKVSIFLDGTFQKEITINSNSLYNLISLPVAGMHELKLEFEDGSVELYAFTFG